MGPTAEQLRSYAADPLAFITDLRLPIPGAPRFGDAMADFQKAAFTALAPALQAVAMGGKPQTARYWWERTKGASKDTDIGATLLWLLAFTRRPLLAQGGAADRDQAGEILKAARAYLRVNPWLAQRVTIQAWRIVCDGTDSTCEILTADAASSHGSRPDVLVLNELSHIGSEDFAQTLFDNLTKMPNGLGIVATNAGCAGTWQHGWRETARQSPRWCFHRMGTPAPWLDPADIEEARIRNSFTRFARLWQGVWATGGGDAIDASDIEASFTLDGPELLADQNSWYIGGLDLGLRRDHSAFVVLAVRAGSGRVRLAWCQSWIPGPDALVNTTEVIQAIAAASRRYKLAVVKYDPFAADLIAGELRKAGIRMVPQHFAGNGLDAMARSVLEAFRGRFIDLYRDEDLARDLRSLCISEGKSGFGYRLTAPRGEHGHADRAIALSIALPPCVSLARKSPMGLRPPSAPGPMITTRACGSGITNVDYARLLDARRFST